ncbi:PalH-domain-containing protein [Hyaloscypha variabilis F]|uniref:PalH-domain-containing protein n=1 Tax=Hyaloscypha variabilis (strain UAMH 11265 / GT02V1 / F) TaxID=1149755 RepID=A0A2J6RKS7_HYAVF|nr:PalH-domain-containing protein [Hyaloscypha variabilis F]
MEERQIINIARPNPTSTTATRAHCTPFTLPSNGVLTLGVGDVLTLTSDAVFRPECTGSSDVLITTSLDLRDPFYASTLPECYALAATTVIAYMLVIMLIITPRTFLHEGAVVLGRRGFTNGPSGSDAGIGFGGRPWLQKVAALTVAVSLTIATADTFKVAEGQYEVGYMDAQKLQNLVENGMELKIIRVISDTFLWLAQAQTLIRLFPRQREKIIIKWTAFSLISLDVLFSILNNFVYNGNSRPRTFVDAVPALAYLFQLALSLLYGAWVIYYAITKKRFAFFHPQMRNICLVALLSLVSVLVPVVFFVLDISKPDLAGWGDYVRWVGAAAASVVVWEWVERIEALEREDKKDGVLGREVFDGDEMLEADPLSDSSWKSRLKSRKDDRNGNNKGGGDGGISTGSNGLSSWPGVANLASRYRPRGLHDIEKGRSGRTKPGQQTTKRAPRSRPPLWPIRPPPAASPVSRTDTASAESTVYAIRYHPVSEPTPIPEPQTVPGVSRTNSLEINAISNDDDNGSGISEKSVVIEQMVEGPEPVRDHRRPNPWQTFAKVNPFRRGPQGPPPEVSAHTKKPPEPANSHPAPNRWDVRARLEDFAATHAEKLREKARPSVNVGPLPVTVIPAPPRRRNLATTYEELEDAEREERPTNSDSNTFVGSPSMESRFTHDQDSTPVLRPQRLSDPYTPDDLNGHSIHQRGAISFLTAVQQSRDGDVPLISPVSPLEEAGERFQSVNSRGSPAQPRTPSSPRRDGLQVMSIPAPARRPRTEDGRE